MTRFERHARRTFLIGGGSLLAAASANARGLRLNTDDIRAAVQAIQAQCAIISDRCNQIDGAVPPPNTSSRPAAVDCLAGTNPNWTTANLYAEQPGNADWNASRSAFRALMAAAPSGSIMCLGDSMIARMTGANAVTAGISPYALNLGHSGESIRQLLVRINDVDANGAPNLIHRAGATIILTGVNDLSDSRNYGSAGIGTSAGRDNCIATMGQIFSKLAGWITGPCVIFKIIKVDAAIFSIPSNDLVIGPVNAHIQSLFGSKPNCRVIDLNPTVAPNGSLLPQYHNGDGQHPSDLMFALMHDASVSSLRSLGVIS